MLGLYGSSFGHRGDRLRDGDTDENVREAGVFALLHLIDRRRAVEGCILDKL